MIWGTSIIQAGKSFLGTLSRNESTDFKPHDFNTVFEEEFTTRVDVARVIEIDLYWKVLRISYFGDEDPIWMEARGDAAKRGFDHHYHYACWDGKQWQEKEIANACTWFMRARTNTQVDHFASGRSERGLIFAMFIPRCSIESGIKAVDSFE